MQPSSTVVPGKVNVLDVAGKPIYVAPTRNEHLEAEINRELAESFDPLLHIRWVPFAYYNERQKAWEGRYALAQWYHQHDKRRQLVRDGKLPPDDACDIMGWFTDNIHSADAVPREPGSMMRKVRELLGQCDATRFPWRDRMLKAIEHNEQQKQRTKQQVLEEDVQEAADYQYYHSSRATRVFQTGGNNGKRN